MHVIMYDYFGLSNYIASYHIATVIEVWEIYKIILI